MTGDLLIVLVVMSGFVLWVLIIGGRDLIQILRARSLRGHVLKAIRAEPGILASVIATRLRCKEIDVRVAIRRLEVEEQILYLPDHGDRRCWPRSRRRR